MGILLLNNSIVGKTNEAKSIIYEKKAQNEKGEVFCANIDNFSTELQRILIDDIIAASEK